MVFKQALPKLVHITTAPQALGFLKGQVGYMRDRGFNVHAVSSPGELLEEFARSEGVNVHAVMMHRRITPLRDLLSIIHMLATILAIRPTIVHSHTPKGGLVGMIAAWLAGVPVRVYHNHGMPYLTAVGHKRVLLRLSERVACRLAHQVLCVSSSIREIAVQDGICPGRKITVVGCGSINGVDASSRFNPQALPTDTRQRTRSRYGIPPDALVAGFVGRIVKDKGVNELVEAWQTLSKEFPELHLLMVGPFEHQDPVAEQTKQALRSDPRIHLVGENRDTPPLYAAMDVVLLPTYREGFPNVPLEAAAMGLPVVITEVPGCVDAVEPNVTGTFVPARDAAALADAIRTYLMAPGLRQRHGKAGRERALNSFGQEGIWEAVYQKYLELLRKRGLLSPMGGA